MVRWTNILAILLVLGLAGAAWACPSCRDTIANTAAGAEDAQALPAGFNYSVYWMLLGLFGVMGMVARTIYKGIQSTQ